METPGEAGEAGDAAPSTAKEAWRLRAPAAKALVPSASGAGSIASTPISDGVGTAAEPAKDPIGARVPSAS